MHSETTKAGPVLALIQARMGSTRFPAKVLTPVRGKPMLQGQLERLRRSRRIDRLVVATSDLPADDAIYGFCRDFGQEVFRGSESSVLDRFYQASLRFLSGEERKSAILVRLTGDCPLTDPALIDEGISEFLELRKSGCRYFGYDDRMPDGMDFEVFTWEALEEAYRKASDSFEKEHATPYMWRHPDRFGVKKFYREGVPPGLRFSVDYREDRELVEAILAVEESRGEFFGLKEISQLLSSNAELRAINGRIIKNEGLVQTSLASEPFQREWKGRKVPICGIFLSGSEEIPGDLTDWGLKMGVRLWAASADRADALGRWLEEKIPGQAEIFVAGQLPADSPLVSFGPGWEENLLRVCRENAGVFLGVSTRAELAQMMILFCQNRRTD